MRSLLILDAERSSRISSVGHNRTSRGCRNKTESRRKHAGLIWSHHVVTVLIILAAAAGTKFRMSLGLPVGAVMNCADNSGAKSEFWLLFEGTRRRHKR